MRNVSIARRYARALLEAAGANSETILEQMRAFTSAFEASPEFRNITTNPAYSRSERQAVVDQVAGLVKATDPFLMNLLRLLVDRSRMEQLPDITRLFRDLADAKAGRLRGEVVSAVPLPTEAMARLEQTLEKVTQRDVVLEARVDARVLGGLAAQIGSLMYDGTLRSQLEDLRRNLQVH